MISSDRIARLPEFGEREEVCGRCQIARRCRTYERTCSDPPAARELQKTLHPPTDWARSPAGAVTTGERRYSLTQTRAIVECD
jgi:hypothetical protein